MNFFRQYSKVNPNKKIKLNLKKKKSDKKPRNGLRCLNRNHKSIHSTVEMSYFCLLCPHLSFSLFLSVSLFSHSLSLSLSLFPTGSQGIFNYIYCRSFVRKGSNWARKHPEYPPLNSYL